MKVRIGNDIRLHVTLLGDRTTDYVNIKSVHAYLVNTSRQHDIDEQHRHDSIDYADKLEERRRLVKYVSRFPAEPRRGYRGTPYDLMHCGHPTFHVHPVWCVAPYIGFGVHPHTFDPYHNHLWGYDDMQDLHAKMMYKEEDYKQQYSECEFVAPVSASDSVNKVYVDFPAECQHYTGTYKLIIVAKLYEAGYGKDNLRTVTMDYMDVFTLVGAGEEGQTGNVSISIGNAKDATGISVFGDTAIALGQVGELKASVMPADIDDSSVEWSLVNPEDSKNLVIGLVQNNSCKFWATSLEEGVDTKQVVIRATSKKTPSVYKDTLITITREAFTDIYTRAGEYQSNNAEGNDRKEYINLNLTDGSNVKIDTTKETVWYEG